MVTIISVWIDLYQKLDSIVDNNLNFFVIIVQAILYAQTSAVLTPEDSDLDGKKYFMDNKRTFFLLIAATALMAIIVQFVVFQDHRTWVPLIAIPLFIICAFYDKLWYRVALSLLVIFLAMEKLFI